MVLMASALGLVHSILQQTIVLLQSIHSHIVRILKVDQDSGPIMVVLLQEFGS